jgi:hypothetical protein
MCNTQSCLPLTPMTTISIRSTSFRDKRKRIILQQSKVGIQQLDSIRLLIKPYIASDDNLSFDRIKQLIGFLLVLLVVEPDYLPDSEVLAFSRVYTP